MRSRAAAVLQVSSEQLSARSNGDTLTERLVRSFGLRSDATLKLNGRSFKIIKLLGEGGFSYVGLLAANGSTRTRDAAKTDTR